ncbi:uncharacterized protein LOC111699805 isoform X2 [Eurytemora carolleeae]|uniref:uncharacterized protein LOC111699805 isoform X2 n=1 Tax=Eurytemora carolleeae TaxID=1294199 RepID=UPI000C760DB6|nr:uncharacterized protein LOC111699805 isoform X2 [Eurytemora carolleeae]|eukprot:XP_023326307.1 uncharacterized protein LOC111699805 isoform X2 [Eurytemora affinis]
MSSSASVPLHVEVEPADVKVLGFNLAPLLGRVFQLIPTSMRENMMAKKSAPKEKSIPRDYYDLFKENPYTTEEVVKDRVWAVQHVSEPMFYTKAPGKWTQHMVVVKLNSGDLFLYNPVKVRNETGFEDWLNGLGKVKYIAIASAYHTLQISGITKKYPDALIIGPREAELKLKVANALPRGKFDYVYTHPEQAQEANQKLGAEGVELLPVVGDAGTSALMAISHKVLMECDIVYSLADGTTGFTDRARFDEMRDEDRGTRLFKLGLLSAPKSPNDALPIYRFWMMDPTCFISSLSISPPNKDGSSCTIMAETLRKILRKDFDEAVGVHNRRVSGDMFRKSVDLNWKWLDGRSLL